MIKANELRIGNYVTTIDDEIRCTSVKGFYGFPVSSGIVNHNNNVNDFEYLTPIPLTEEWLIKFGFCQIELDNGENYYQNNRFRLNCNYNGFYYSRNLDVKYVHQLQNIYFALTSQELTIKENENDNN
jgi:hypothetical protein